MLLTIFSALLVQNMTDIPTSEMDPCKYINVSNLQNYFFLEPVSPIEVNYHIRNLKNSKQDIDSISISIFKEYREYFSNIIADLINHCFETGIFPKLFYNVCILNL